MTEHQVQPGDIPSEIQGAIVRAALETAAALVLRGDGDEAAKGARIVSEAGVAAWLSAEGLSPAPFAS